MTYKYFVSYFHNSGYGRCEIVRDTFISSIEDIAGIEDAISKQNGFKNISIISFQLLENCSNPSVNLEEKDKEGKA